MRDYETKGEEV